MLFGLPIAQFAHQRHQQTIENQIQPFLPWGIGIGKQVEDEKTFKSISFVIDPFSRRFQTCSILAFTPFEGWKIGADLLVEGEEASSSLQRPKSQIHQKTTIKGHKAILKASGFDGKVRVETLFSTGGNLKNLFKELQQIRLSFVHPLSSSIILGLEASSRESLIQITCEKRFEFLKSISAQFASQFCFSPVKKNGTLNFSLFLQSPSQDDCSLGLRINPVFGHFDVWQSWGPKGIFASHFYFNPFSLESEIMGSFGFGGQDSMMMMLFGKQLGMGRILFGNSSLNGTCLGIVLEKAQVALSDDNPIELSVALSLCNWSKIKFGLFLDC